MARALIGKSTGPKVQLDDDCGATTYCDGVAVASDGTSPVISGNSIVGYLPTLALVQRVRSAIDEDGIPVFDWAELQSGKAIMYEKRDEWDAEVGATVVRARMMLSNTEDVTMVPETAVVLEDTDPVVAWNVQSSTVFPDRIELEAQRIWREASGEQDEVIEVFDGGDAFTEEWDVYFDSGGA